MSEPQDSAIFWNKHETLAYISELGPNGVNNSTSIVPGKFGNAAEINANLEYITYSGVGLTNHNTYGVGQWIKTEFAVVNGNAQDGAAHIVFRIFDSGGFAGQLFIHNTLGIFFQHGTTGNLLLDTVSNWNAGDWIYVLLILDRSAGFDGAKTCAIYLNGIQTGSVTTALGDRPNNNNYVRIGNFSGGTFQLDGAHDNLKIYNVISPIIVSAIIDNRNTEAWPGPPAIVPIDFKVKQPQVLILNSQIDLYALGYVKNINDIEERKTFQRDKVITNQMSIPLHNQDNQFNPGHQNSILNGTNWRYQLCQVIDEDDNLIWDGELDDFLSDEKTKSVNMLSKNVLLKRFQTVIEYESADFETPGNAFKNICDAYDMEYNTQFVEDSIAQYTLNNCFIKCNFNISDGVKFQQAIEKIAKFGAADCYSANNQLNFKLYVQFTGGAKFNLADSDLASPIKRKLLRKYFNNYIIGYVGDLDTPAQDVDNDNIGLVSRNNNGKPDFKIDGSDGKQIEIQDLVSAVFIGNTNIRRTHVDLFTKPFPVNEIQFSLDYKHKDFITLQTWFRLTNIANGWNNKLFEMYISRRSFTKKRFNIVAYEVDGS